MSAQRENRGGAAAVVFVAALVGFVAGCIAAYIWILPWVVRP